MKKSRIFMAAGTAVLAISAVFATKASKKFTTGLTTAWVKSGSTYAGAIQDINSILTTKNGTGEHQAYLAIVTSSGTSVFGSSNMELLTAPSSTKAVFFK